MIHIEVSKVRLNNLWDLCDEDIYLILTLVIFSLKKEMIKKSVGNADKKITDISVSGAWDRSKMEW